MCVGRKPTARSSGRRTSAIGFAAKGENNMATPSPRHRRQDRLVPLRHRRPRRVRPRGQPKWARNTPKNTASSTSTGSTAPARRCYDGRLYVQVLHATARTTTGSLANAKKAPPPSYLLALDPATGKDIWKHVRPDEARGETKESYATPIPLKTADGREMLCSSAATPSPPTTPPPATSSGAAPAGTRRRSPTGGSSLPSSPAAASIIACAPKGGPVYAIKSAASAT